MSVTVDKDLWRSVLREGFTPPPVSPDDDPVVTAIAASRAVQEHLLASSSVRTYLEQMPLWDEETVIQGSPLNEICRYVAIQRAQIDKSDPARNLLFISDLVFPALWFERETVLQALNRCATLSDDERRLIDLTGKLAIIHDALWHLWFERLAVPYQSLPKNERARAGDLLKSQLPQFDYTAYKLFDGEILNRQPWRTAFNPVDQIVYGLSVLRPFDSEPLNRYFVALRAAYSCDTLDADVLEAGWAVVDEAFLALPPTLRFLPVHGIESGYEHPVGVSPDFRLHARTDYYRGEINRIRGAVEGYAAHLLGEDSDRVAAYRQRLVRTDAAVFGDIIRSGVCANFRLAGQSLPNRPEVAHRSGGRIILDKASGELMQSVYQDAVRKHCTAETAAWITPLVTPDSFLEHTASHEFSHPLWRSSSGDASLGEAKDLLEEAKASCFGIAAMLWADPGPERVRSLAAHVVARTFRNFHRSAIGNPTVAPYVRECAVAMTTLCRASGILREASQGIVVNQERIDGNRWRTELERFLVPLTRAYANTDRQALQQLADEYCQMGPSTPLGDIAAWINR